MEEAKHTIPIMTIVYWLALAIGIGCGIGAAVKYKSDIYADSTTEAACQKHTTSTAVGAACGAWVQSKGHCLKGRLLDNGGCLHKDTTFQGLFLASSFSLLVWVILQMYNMKSGSKLSLFLVFVIFGIPIGLMVYVSIDLLGKSSEYKNEDA